MHYSDYKNARDMAWEILLDCRVRELPVRTSALCRELGIAFRLYEPKDENDGLCFIADGAAHILVSAHTSRARQRFTAAHEMGHVLLGHVGKYQLVSREPSGSDNPIETQANVFASRLLAPACVLWGCGAKTAEDIMALCDLSRSAAEFRKARMDILYEREKFLTSPLERRVYEQFRAYIRDNQMSSPGSGS